MAAFAAARTDTLVAAGRPFQLALASGYQLAFMVSAGAVALAALLTLTVLHTRA